MMMPCGLSSETTVKDAKYCVQTEFAQRPKPRVTTTISLNGEVVDKVENSWEGSPLTEEDKQDVERFVKRQHQKVLEKIKEKDEGTDSPDKGRSGLGEEDPILKADQVLAATSGVLGWAFILEDGQVLSRRISIPEDKHLFEQVRELSFLLPALTNLGSFGGGILESPERLSLFVPLQAHFLGVKLDPQVDPKEVVNRITAVA